MRVFSFELRKYMKNKFFISIFFIFLFLCGAFFYFDIQMQLISPTMYNKIHKQIDSLPLNEANDTIQDLQDTYTFYDQYQIASNPLTVIDQFKQTNGQEWVSKKLSKVEKFEAFDFHSSQELLKRITMEINSIKDYSDYRANMLKQINTNKNISIFKDDKNAAINAKIIKVYEHVKNKIPLKVAPTLGIETLIKFSLPDILCILLILYMIGISVFQERKKGFTSFTETMLHGKRTQYLAKISAIAVMTSFWLLCAYAICGMIVQFTFSFPPLDTFLIQGIPLLMKTILNGNVLYLIIVFLLFKIIIMTLLGCISYVLAQRIASYTLFLFIIICFMGISYFAYTTIPELSNLVIFKYMNLYAFTQTQNYLGNYICFSIFGIPLSIYQLSAIAWIIIFIVLILMSNCNSLRINVKKITLRQTKHQLQPHSLLFYELKKVWIKDFGAILFIILVLLQGCILMNTKSNITMDNIYYNYYIDTIGDSVSKSATSKIYKLTKRYEELQQHSSSTLNYKDIDMNNRLSAFLKYKENYAILKEKKKGVLLKENEYAILYEDNLINKVSFMLLYIGIIVAVASCFYRDKENHVTRIQMMSINGRAVLWRNKMIALLSFNAPLCILLYTMVIIKNQQFYPNINYQFSISNLSAFHDAKLAIPIIYYLYLSIVLKIVTLCAIQFVVSYLTKKFQNRYSFLLVAFSFCVIGFIFSYLTGLKILNPIYMLIHNSLIQNKYLFSICFICLITASILCYQKGKRL